MKKTRFTLVDALIILIVLAVLAFAVLKFKPDLIKNNEDTQAEVTVLVTSADSELVDTINIDDKVSISFSETAYATVTDVTAEDHIDYAFNNIIGEYRTQTVEGKSDIKIKLLCDAEVSDTKIENNGVVLRVGTELPVRGKGYVVKGYIIDVNDR